ncbi:hypothetical protein REPUB_Repub13aG0043100 [Reevesia pubescens]
MSVEESWTTVSVKQESVPIDPDLGTASFVLSQFPHPHVAESKIAHIDSATNQHLTCAQLHRSVGSLACGLYQLGVQKGDVVFLLSPNSILYTTIYLAIFSVGPILSLAKQVLDSGAKFAISAPEELHKLIQAGVSTIVTHRHGSNDDSLLSIEELIECCDPCELPAIKVKQSDAAAILYSSGTTGTSKEGVILPHSNFITTVRLVRWYAEGTSSKDDIFLGFIPIFHIYGLGLFCAGITTVLMQRFEFQVKVNAIQAYKVNNIPAVPPVVIGLVKYRKGNSSLSTLRRIGSGAAPLSKELTDAFRGQFPWVELWQGHRLTESCGAASGLALPPYKEGELWLKSPTIMKGYLGNEEATAATIDKDG